MKIIFKKTARRIAEDITNQMRILLKANGRKPKEEELLKFKKNLLKNLGG